MSYVLNARIGWMLSCSLAARRDPSIKRGPPMLCLFQRVAEIYQFEIAVLNAI